MAALPLTPQGKSPTSRHVRFCLYLFVSGEPDPQLGAVRFHQHSDPPSSFTIFSMLTSLFDVIGYSTFLQPEKETDGRKSHDSTWTLSFLHPALRSTRLVITGPSAIDIIRDDRLVKTISTFPKAIREMIQSFHDQVKSHEDFERRKQQRKAKIKNKKISNDVKMLEGSVAQLGLESETDKAEVKVLESQLSHMEMDH